MHYRRIDLIESIDCIRYAKTTDWSFQTEQHKEKKRSRREPYVWSFNTVLSISSSLLQLLFGSPLSLKGLTHFTRSCSVALSSLDSKQHESSSLSFRSLVPVESRALLDTASEALRQSISIISIIEPAALSLSGLAYRSVGFYPPGRIQRISQDLLLASQPILSSSTSSYWGVQSIANYPLPLTPIK